MRKGRDEARGLRNLAEEKSEVMKGEKTQYIVTVKEIIIIH